jgi:hypothetical protein
VELGGDPKGDRVDRFESVLEWAINGRPTPVRYVPVPVEPPVFAPMPSRGRSLIEYDWMDELQGITWLSAPVIDDASIRSRTKPVSLMAWVVLAAGGWVDHVFLESPSGRADVDRVVVRGLLTLRGPAGRAGRSGRVRVSLAGMETTGPSRIVDKE